MARQRKFDWQKAAEMYESGLSSSAVGEHFGVTSAAVRHALAEQGIERRTCGPQPTTVRDDELRCSTCGEWKPDEAFSVESSVNYRARRQRRRTCRTCDTKLRRDYRVRNRERENKYSREYKRRVRTAA